MARIAGKAGQVWADVAPGPATEADLVLGVTSWELDLKGDAIDTTGMDGAGIKEFIAGLTEGTGSIECFADGSLDADIAPGGSLSVILLYANGDASAWYGTAILTGKKPTISVEGAVKWSLGIQFTGTIAYGVIPV